ncbi:hypothetical protein B0H13DRAFT_1853120 [Mycena leptocephala]|nr:hypothetical protein B0H13DRAFT_1853120 [Mycena leptocephala]
MSSIESPVEKAIMPPSEIFRDGIVQNDQGYPFPQNQPRRWLWNCTGIEINPKANEFGFSPGSPRRQEKAIMPPSKIFRDGIVQNDQMTMSYQLPSSRRHRALLKASRHRLGYIFADTRVIRRTLAGNTAAHIKFNSPFITTATINQ